MIGVGEPMPSVPRNEYRCPLFKGVMLIIQDEDSATFQDVEDLIHLEVSMDWNACARGNLLGPQGMFAGPLYGVDLDEHVTGVTKMNETLAPCSVEDVSLGHGSCSLSHWRLLGVVVGDEDAEVRAGLLNKQLTFS